MNITDISGIGDATAQRLKAHGIDSVEAVAQASIEQLAAVPGIGASRAVALRESARGLLPDASADGQKRAEAVPAPAGDAAEGSETAAAPADDGSEAKRKKDGKKEKGKKDKKKRGKAEKKKEKKRKGRKKGKGGKKKKNKRK